MPAEIAARGDPRFDRFARHLHRAAVQWVRTVDGLRGLGPAGSEQAGQPHDLTGTHLDRHVIEHVTACQAGRSQQRARLLRRVVGSEARPGSSNLGQLAAEHPGDELESRDLRDGSGVHPPPVTKHGHHVAQPEHLVEPVRDIDDRHAVPAQEMDDLHQALDFAWLERGGGLVHDDDPVIGVDRARNGDHLLHAKSQLPERTPDVDMDAVPREARAGFAMHPPEVDEPEARRRLAAEEQVPRHAHQRDQVHLLVDRADPGCLRVQRPGEGHRLAAVHDRALVRLMHAGEDLDEGGLSRPVLPDQGVNLPCAQLDRHIRERQDAGKPLRDALNLKDGGLGDRRHATLTSR